MDTGREVGWKREGIMNGRRVWGRRWMREMEEGEGRMKWRVGGEERMMWRKDCEG